MWFCGESESGTQVGFSNTNEQVTVPSYVSTAARGPREFQGVYGSLGRLLPVCQELDGPRLMEGVSLCLPVSRVLMIGEQEFIRGASSPGSSGPHTSQRLLRDPVGSLVRHVR
jgi:hypothetical protein